MSDKGGILRAPAAPPNPSAPPQLGGFCRLRSRSTTPKETHTHVHTCWAGERGRGSCSHEEEEEGGHIPVPPVSHSPLCRRDQGQLWVGFAPAYLHTKPVLREQMNAGCERLAPLLFPSIINAALGCLLAGEPGSFLGKLGAVPLCSDPWAWREPCPRTPQRLFWDLQLLALPLCWKEGSSAFSCGALMLVKWNIPLLTRGEWMAVPCCSQGGQKNKGSLP